MIILKTSTNPRTGQLVQRVQFDSGSVVSVYGDPSFLVEQMESLGEYSIGLIKTRAQSGIGSDDAPMPPLSQRWARQKARSGGIAMRNLTYTGEMLGALSVRSVSERQVKADITSAAGRIKAEANEQIAAWYGWSPNDVAQLDAFSGAMFEANADRAMNMIESPSNVIAFPVPRYSREMAATGRLAA